MPDGLVMNPGALAAKFTAQTQRFAQRFLALGAKATEAQARDLHQVIIQTSPVDTGLLRGSWDPPSPRGSPLIWGTGTTLEYALKLEYGGYTRVGPRTVELGGGDLGHGFVAGHGIYSQQAPLGFVRRALAGAAEPYRLRIRNALQGAWGDATVTVTGSST